MKVTRIRIDNYLGIAMLQTGELGSFNIITGPNRAGKSTVLAAITAAFQSDGIEPKVIHAGKDRAEIFLHLDDGTTIERKITPKGNTLKVLSNGKPVSKPQTVLDNLFDPRVFNPVRFFQAKPAERRQMILAGVKLELTSEFLAEQLGDQAGLIDLTAYNFGRHGLELLQQIQTDVYNIRAEVNRDVSRLEKSIEQEKDELPETFDPEELAAFDYQARFAEYEAAVATVNTHNTDQAAIEQKRIRYDAIAREIADLEGRIALLKEEQEKVTREGAALRAKIDEYVAPDIAAMKSALDTYQKNQKLVVKLEAIKKREAESEGLKNRHGDLDRLYQQLVTDVPRAVLATAELPADELEIRGDDIFVKGVSIDTLSTSEKIRFAVNMARFLSRDRELKIILVDGLEALDSEARAAFEEEATGDGFEYFVTQVADNWVCKECQTIVATDQLVDGHCPECRGEVEASRNLNIRATSPGQSG